MTGISEESRVFLKEKMLEKHRKDIMCAETLDAEKRRMANHLLEYMNKEGVNEMMTYIDKQTNPKWRKSPLMYSLLRRVEKDDWKCDDIVEYLRKKMLGKWAVKEEKGG